MTLRHVLDRLPLWVGGDLPKRETETVQAHLDRCPDCRAAAERLRTTRTWLREALEPPFDAADHAHLREAVLVRVRSAPPPRPISRLASRMALLAACAAALLVAVLATLRPGTPVAPPQPRAVPATPLAASLPRALPRPTPPEPARPALARARPVPEGPSRIEFQTSDPTVRIIWLAQATPPSDPNPSLPEAP